MSMAATSATQSVAATQHPADLQSEPRCSAQASSLRRIVKSGHCHQVLRFASAEGCSWTVAADWGLTPAECCSIQIAPLWQATGLVYPLAGHQSA